MRICSGYNGNCYNSARSYGYVLDYFMKKKQQCRDLGLGMFGVYQAERIDQTASRHLEAHALVWTWGIPRFCGPFENGKTMIFQWMSWGMFRQSHHIPRYVGWLDDSWFCRYHQVPIVASLHHDVWFLRTCSMDFYSLASLGRDSA